LSGHATPFRCVGEIGGTAVATQFAIRPSR